ncbi:uncharacterized protein LOC123715206 [Pieris brassicae]|uniref:uncharacterized protein LOC123715206 n=1 Tax=Pieris brassicae TaxID=7116 RepID=UPI001E65E818|nr:uncharacterized protein LOC123715206 [Pieris brassicae]
MAGFKALREASLNLGQELKAQADNLLCAKVNDNFEDVVRKKQENLSFLTSKLRLLQAKTVSVPMQVKETEIDAEGVINNYTETVTLKLIEQQFVKNVTQSNAVKELLATPNEALEPELVERKKNILEVAAEFADKELKLQHLYNTLKEEHSTLLQMRKEWDTVRAKLKSNQRIIHNKEQGEGPLYRKLQSVVAKMEQMRWMIPKLVIAKSRHYDWASDPNSRLKVLALTRQCYTVQSFTDN